MLHHADDLRNYKEDIQYLCKPFLQRKGSLFLAAPPKHYKTMLTMQLAVSIAAEKPFLNHAVTRNCRGLYIEQEIGTAAIKERYELMRQSMGLNHVDLDFWTRDKFRLSLDAGTKGRTELHSVIQDAKPDFVVLDPLRKMTGADENSSTEMTKVFAQLTELQEELDFAAIILHHTSKPSDNRQAGTPDSMRGSGEIFAHGDCYGIFHKPSSSNPQNMDVHWTFRNHAPIDQFRMVFNDSRGLFELRGADPEKPKGKGKLQKMKLEDLSNGLIPAED